MSCVNGQTTAYLLLVDEIQGHACSLQATRRQDMVQECDRRKHRDGVIDGDDDGGSGGGCPRR